jgi:membrane protein DedA with SNARE-associated domain
LPIVALIVFISATGIPTGVPIKVVLLLAGAYLVGSLPGLAVAIVVAAGAELAGTMALHGVARTGGVRLLDRLASERQAHVHNALDRWRGRLGGHDIGAIAVLRLIPFVRMGVAVGAGLVGVRIRDFAIGAGIAALIWTAVPLTLGYAFRSSLEQVEQYYGSVVDALPFLLAIVVIIVVFGTLSKSAATRTRLRELLGMRAAQASGRSKRAGDAGVVPTSGDV